MPTQPRLLRWHSLAIPVTFQSAAAGTWTHGASDREVRLICLHSAECKEVDSSAEALAAWLSGPQAPKASWHFAVDSNSITQSVELYDVAWHAGQINSFSVGIEQSGRASQTAEQWADPYSVAVLNNTAKLIALISGIYDIPIEHVSNPKDAKARGVTLHADVTRSFAVKGGHSDPGPNYPLTTVLELARQIQLDAVR